MKETKHSRSIEQQAIEGIYVIDMGLCAFEILALKLYLKKMHHNKF